jgi:hypothetical protein
MAARDGRTAAFLVAIAAVLVQCSPSRRFLRVGPGNDHRGSGHSLLVCTLVLPSRLRSLPRVRHRNGHPQPPGLATAEMALAMKGDRLTRARWLLVPFLRLVCPTSKPITLDTRACVIIKAARGVWLVQLRPRTQIRRIPATSQVPTPAPGPGRSAPTGRRPVVVAVTATSPIPAVIPLFTPASAQAQSSVPVGQDVAIHALDGVDSDRQHDARDPRRSRHRPALSRACVRAGRTTPDARPGNRWRRRPRPPLQRPCSPAPALQHDPGEPASL